MPMKAAIGEIFNLCDSFILLGLTGRSGSGCTTAADLLTKAFREWNLEEAPLEEGASNKTRKDKVIYEYSKTKWEPFTKIQVRDIITSFILEEKFNVFSKYVESTGLGSIESIKKTYNEFYKLNKCIDPIAKSKHQKANAEKVFQYLKDLSSFTALLKTTLDNDTTKGFIKAYQAIGNNIRKYGIAIEGEAHVGNIYAIARRINGLIKVLRRHNRENKQKDFFVIDAFRNQFEVLFFQQRYASFYLAAISSSESDRRDRMRGHGYTDGQLETMDKNEYSGSSPLKNLDTLVRQDIGSCIQLADLHFYNHGDSKNKNLQEFKKQILRYIALMRHPALVYPSRDERMMQIAYTAKLNSGCLSRQVGAVVTNSEGAPRAIGWNSSPDEQVPCLLRDARELTIENPDVRAYSAYEIGNASFQEEIKKRSEILARNLEKTGLRCCFCFKDIQSSIETKKKDPETKHIIKNVAHIRALHAEENAFLQITKYGGEGIRGGKLYVTASPCDLCARKAFQLGLSEIHYIDPYPGIAIEHVIECGDKDKRPRVFTFRGAVGSAYAKLYEPIIQIKDEISVYSPE